MKTKIYLGLNNIYTSPKVKQLTPDNFQESFYTEFITIQNIDTMN